MAGTTTSSTAPRIGARVLLLDPHNRVLLIHARDPDQPKHHWWELPGGGVDRHETLADAARREVAEETGIHLDHLGPKLWIRESRFHYRGHNHHRIDHVYLARTATAASQLALRPTDNEKHGLIERRWRTLHDLDSSTDKLLPPQLPRLLHQIIDGTLPTEPVILAD
ncbi:NUDIX domain-containing protein [Actinosynnema sp. NPDC023587]|uniref:NUDIX hydrolase n=1 Tax=Actinosynnema sp. NPDC023587 TaxID=3154695 RepID=UPI00340A5F6B